MSPDTICSICQSRIDPQSLECAKCFTKMEKCVVCFNNFEVGDEILQCDECLNLGHKTHMEGWFSFRKSCPICKIGYRKSGFKSIVVHKKTIKETYSRKFTIYQKRQEIFDEFSFRLEFYDFQSALVNNLKHAYERHDRHLLVSPPGSGKTIIGLALARELGTNTLVLTPNLAVLGSWIDRCSMFYETETELKVNEVINKEIGDLRPFSILTYSKMHKEIKDFDYEDYMERINDHHYLRDEAFEKPKRKKKKSKAKAKPDPDIKIKDNMNFIERLLGHNIGLIILDEAHRLTGRWGEEILFLINKFSNIKVLGLTATPPEAYDKEFDELFNNNITHIPLPQLVREKILVPYRDLTVMLPKPGSLKLGVESEIFDQLILEGKRELKFIKSDPYSDHAKWLNKNSALKLAMAITILHHEYQIQKDKLRALVLTDQENFPKNLSKKYKGLGGSIGVFEALVEDKTVDELQPIMVTGSSLLIDDDFADEFMERANIWAKENKYQFRIRKRAAPRNKKYAILKGSGDDWSTDTYTRIVTYLLDSGITQLLVGTRHLFGEGWDSREINTIIDLTTISAYTTVNQVRGRALRQSGRVEGKVSNIWDFVPSDLTDKELFTVEYENYKTKYNKYFGIDETGAIRSGINRLHPKLLKNHVDEKAEKINKHMFDLAKNRELAHELWKVGEDLGDLYLALVYTLDRDKTEVHTILGMNIVYPRTFKHQIAFAFKYVYTTILQDLGIDTHFTVIPRWTEEETWFSVILDPSINEYLEVNNYLDMLNDTSSNTGFAIRVYFEPITNYYYEQGDWYPDEKFEFTFFVPYKFQKTIPTDAPVLFKIKSISEHVTVLQVNSKKLANTAGISLEFEFFNEIQVENAYINEQEFSNDIYDTKNLDDISIEQWKTFREQERKTYHKYLHSWKVENLQSTNGYQYSFFLGDNSNFDEYSVKNALKILLGIIVGLPNMKFSLISTSIKRNKRDTKAIQRGERGPGYFIEITIPNVGKLKDGDYIKFHDSMIDNSGKKMIIRKNYGLFRRFDNFFRLLRGQHIRKKSHDALVFNTPADFSFRQKVRVKLQNIGMDYQILAVDDDFVSKHNNVMLYNFYALEYIGLKRITFKQK